MSGADSIYCTRTWYSVPGELSECLAQHVIMSVMDWFISAWVTAVSLAPWIEPGMQKGD